MPDFAQDLRHALRGFFRQPGLHFVAAVTLALAIGANAAILSVAAAVLLDPLPYRDSERLVILWEDASRIGFPKNTPAPGNYHDWKKYNTVFSGTAALRGRSFNLTGAGEPERLDGRLVTHDLFDVLGVSPALGRAFTAADDRPGAGDVAILSHALWKARFGGDASVIGRKVLLDGAPHTVVGVMPAGFDFPEKGTQIWVPIAFTPEQAVNRGSHFLRVVARLRPGVTLAAARREMDAIGSRLEREHPDFNTGLGVRVESLREHLVGNTETALLLLLAAAACVLLIAASNIANLLLSRAVARRREFAIRVALGAGRVRLLRQLMAEALVLSAIGAGLGLLAASWGLDLLAALVPPDLTSARVALDARTVLFAAALCCGTTLFFGALPLRHASRLAIAADLVEAGGRAGDSHRTHRLRGALVVSQTAFAALLLVGAGLVLQTFLRVRAVDPGFRGDHVLTLRTSLPLARYAEPARRTAFYYGVLDRVRNLPGVIDAGYTSWLPFTNFGGTTSFDIEGRPDPPPGQLWDANVRLVTPGYLRATGMRLLAGRFLTDADRQGAEPVAVVNRTLSRKFWAGENALNRRFRPCNECAWIRVAGIAADVRQKALDTEARPEAYIPYVQFPERGVLFFAPQDLAIRTSGDPAALAPAVRRAIREVDPQQPVAMLRVMSDYVEEDLAPRRLQALLVGGMALLALLLAAIGIYGVLSYSVVQSRREIGVRLALGAEPGRVVRLVAWRGLRPALSGLAAGVAAAWAAAGLIAGLLYGVPPRDPATFAGATAVLLAICVAAAWLPARRAAQSDPVEALRQE